MHSLASALLKGTDKAPSVDEDSTGKGCSRASREPHCVAAPDAVTLGEKVPAGGSVKTTSVATETTDSGAEVGGSAGRDSQVVGGRCSLPLRRERAKVKPAGSLGKVFKREADCTKVDGATSEALGAKVGEAKSGRGKIASALEGPDCQRSGHLLNHVTQGSARGEV